jgi:hypothetical protein
MVHGILELPERAVFGQWCRGFLVRVTLPAAGFKVSRDVGGLAVDALKP